MAGPDIFLSYNREDQATAKLFADAFASEGMDVWWDQTLRSGETYDEVTEAALRGAKAVVVLWSPRSVASHWVRAEATIAHRAKTLVPATIEPCDKPVMFELTQTAELSHWQGDRRDPAWQAFLGDVRGFVGADAVPLPSAVQAVSGSPWQDGRGSIAVLPFVNRSGLAEGDIFAECMVEDLTIALSASPRMKVTAASATAAYRIGARDLRQIGADLAVRYLLEGNVRRAGDDLRLTIQLIDAPEGNILWTQRSDLPMSELFDRQEDLVAELAAKLGMRVESAEIDQALHNQGSLSGWDATWRAYEYTSHGSLSSMESAVADLQRAADANPDDALPLAFLASYQGQLWHYRGGDDPEFAQEIERNVRRARALAPNNPEVLMSAGIALAWIRKPQEALPYLERVAALNPNFHTGNFVFGMALAMLGRSDEAIAALDKADRFAPMSRDRDFSSRWRSVAHLLAGRHQEALEAAELSLRGLPGSESHLQKALCLAVLGDREAAKAVVRNLRNGKREYHLTFMESLVRGLYCGSGRSDEFAAIVRELWDAAEAGA